MGYSMYQWDLGIFFSTSSSSLHLHFSRHLRLKNRLPAGPDQPHPLFIRVVVLVKELRQVNFETFIFEICFRFRDPRLCEIVLSVTVNFEIRDSQSKMFVAVSEYLLFSLLFVEMIQFDEYVSKGLKPAGQKDFAMFFDQVAWYQLGRHRTNEPIFVLSTCRMWRIKFVHSWLDTLRFGWMCFGVFFFLVSWVNATKRT